MDESLLYRIHSRTSKLPPCTFDVTFLKELYRILSELTAEAAQLEAASIRYPELPDIDIEKTRQIIIIAYKLDINVSAESGHSVASSTTIFDNTTLLAEAKKIAFGNENLFKIAMGREPKYTLALKLDLAKPDLFNLSIHSSEPTQNTSQILLFGYTDTWVNGAYEKIMKAFRGHQARFRIIHKRNVFDLLLWLGFFPLTYWNIYKIDKQLTSIIQSSAAFQASLYIFILFVIIFLSRVLFNYTRWVFPYMELDLPSVRSTALPHRLFIGGLFTFIIFSLLYDLILKIFHILVY